MRAEYGKIEGDLKLQDALQLYGMVTGNTYVGEGATLELFGTCGRDLLVAEGGEVQVHGTVIGEVSNRGGRLSIFGVVKGGVTTRGGETKIDPKAVVEGDVRDDT